MNSPTVYVIQNQHYWDKEKQKFCPKFDFTPAKEHGEIKYLLEPNATPFTPYLVEELKSKLLPIKPEDSIVLVGNPAIIGISVAVAAKYNDGSLNVLQWSGKDKRYVKITIKDLFTF